MSIDFKNQYFGCEIEMTGITRRDAANALATLFGSSYHYEGGGCYTYSVTDPSGKVWKLMRDSSITAQKRRNGTRLAADDEYKVEMVTPKLEYAEMERLQEVVRALRHSGAFPHTSCGMHVHVDATNHTSQSLKNALSIMYSKEDILFLALNVNERRVQRWCKKVEEPVLKNVRKLRANSSMDQLRAYWYQNSNDPEYHHYNDTRYHALNLHSVFYRGTLEWRCFESTLHAGEVRANITLTLAISAQAINQTRTVARKTPIGDNPAFTFRTFLLRLGLIGPEYKNVREHLLKNLPGDRAWRYDKSQYPCNQRRDNGAR